MPPSAFDSDVSSTHSDALHKLDGFPSELLDALRRNHWMTSFGISGCFRSESVDDLRRNTHLMEEANPVAASRLAATVLVR